MKNSTFILELLEAIQLAKSLVIIKVHGCSIDNFEEREGNYLALVAAKSVTLQQSQSILEAPEQPTWVTGDLKDLLQAQHATA